MTLEEVLVDLGDKPISSLRKSTRTIAFLNGNLTGQLHVSNDSVGIDILTFIYSLPDTELQRRILTKRFKVNTDPYRNLIMILSGFLGFITLGSVITILKTGEGLTENHVGLFSTILDAIVEIIKTLLQVS